MTTIVPLRNQTKEELIKIIERLRVEGAPAMTQIEQIKAAHNEINLGLMATKHPVKAVHFMEASRLLTQIIEGVEGAPK